MKGYLKGEARKAAWWEWPVMILSGFLTALGVDVAVTDFGDGDFFVTLVAMIAFLAMLSWPLILTLRRRLRRKQAEALNQCLEIGRAHV